MKQREFLKELKAKSITKLIEELKKAYKAKEELIFSLSLNKEKNTRKLGQEKRKIAQILTIIGEKNENEQEN